MSKFQLSSEVDRNKIFLVACSMLQGRLDPYFHKTEFKDIESAISACCWPSYKLRDLFQISRGGSPRPIEKYLATDGTGYNWIKIGDTKGVDKYISKTKHKIKPEGVQYSRQVLEGDFLLSNSMSFGKPFIMKTSGYIHDGWLLFRPRTDLAEKDYLHIILSSDFIYKLFTKHTIGGVVENLNIDLVKNISIPVPPIAVQREIIAIMDSAYQAKEKSNLQAKQLLNSISDYLLQAIELELLSGKKHKLENRIFQKQFSEISGERFDPFFHSLNKTNMSGKFKFSQLKEIAHLERGESVSSKDITDGKIPVIAGGQTSPYNHNIANYDGNIITVSSSGTAGYVWYHEGPIFASDCTVIFSKTKAVKTKFLFECLKAQQQQIYKLQKGTIQPHVYLSDLEKILIPVPEERQQVEIISHIAAIREKANRLRQQAHTNLELAKKEVAAIILSK